MATGSKLPTSSARRRGAPRKTDSGPAPGVEPPKPPTALDEPQAASWGELWAEPVARFWAPSDGVLVARLIRLRERLELEGSDAPLGMYAAVLALERVLYLTPTARRDRLRLAVSDPPPAVSANGNGNGSGSSSARPPTARERERLLRG